MVFPIFSFCHEVLLIFLNIYKMPFLYMTLTELGHSFGIRESRATIVSTVAVLAQAAKPADTILLVRESLYLPAPIFLY